MYFAREPLRVKIIQDYSVDWGGIATIAIAVIAILASEITLFIQRKHNRNSVKPVLVIKIKAIKNEILVAIKNCGLGPPKIIDFIIKRKDKTNPIAYDNFQNVLQSSLTLMTHRAAHLVETQNIIIDSRPTGKWI